MTCRLTEETIRHLCSGSDVRMKKGPPGLTVRIEFFKQVLSPVPKGEDFGSFILEIPNDEIATGKVQFGLAEFSIYHDEVTCDEDSDLDFNMQAKSAVLWDIQIYREEDRRKGIGSEWLGVMKEFAKSQGAERFYAANVKTEREGFFAKTGFIQLKIHPDWWRMQDF